MDLEARLAAIEANQEKILSLLVKNQSPAPVTMSLKEAAKYTGFSPDHFRRLAVEQRIIPFSRPSGQQKGKLIFRKSDIDSFLEKSLSETKTTKKAGRKRKSKTICLW